LPHAVDVEHAGSYGVEYKRQVDDGRRLGVAKQKEELAAGFLLPQIHAFETKRKIGGRRIQVYPDHVESSQLRQEPSSEISGDSGNDYGWF
jgi:hypothetical protein